LTFCFTFQQARGNTTSDYSAQWAEYYRSVGKHEEAAAIEAQLKPAVFFRTPQQTLSLLSILTYFTFRHLPVIRVQFTVVPLLTSQRILLTVDMSATSPLTRKPQILFDVI